MTDGEKTAHAIGYLRGISAVLWNLDRDGLPVSLSCEEAAFYDEQVDVLAKAALGKGAENGNAN